MLLPESFLGVLLALTAAVVWGGGDFSGGYATRRNSQFQVLALSALSGMVILVAAAVVWQEALPTSQSVLWAILAGIVGAAGIAALYHALSLGNIASAAPASAVIGAALPVGFSTITRGMPTTAQLIGFILAFGGIWMVSQSNAENNKTSRQGFWLACLAGIGFGGFFILIAQVETTKVFIPLIIARVVAFCIAMFFLTVNRQSFPSPAANPVAMLAGFLDAGGNVFYLLARQFTRLDVAAVLSSFYPMVTVLLAGLLLKEKISRGQSLGILLCLMAIILITI